MTTEQKIDELVEKRYKNYKPRAYRNLKYLHGLIRRIEVPYTTWQLVKAFFGFGLPEKKVINNDEYFLSFLEKAEIDNPKPVYKITQSIVELLESGTSNA